MHAAHAPLIRELEDPLGSRIERTVQRMPEPGQTLSGGPDAMGHLGGDLARRRAVAHPLRGAHEQPGALLGGPEDDRTAAEDARRDRTLERTRVGRQRHPGGDVRRHHPVLGDRHEQRIQEEPLFL